MSSKNYTGNTMVIAHFHDFYFLEALAAQMSMAKSAKPELEFRHSFAKLENDIAEEFARMTKSMALRIFVYLWAAALGEARHADDYCAMWIRGFESVSRHKVYSNAANYMPTGENLQIVHDVYAQKWTSTSFGGQKWFDIVKGLELYGTISDAAFIDHAADLEHNGGCAFNKDAKDETGLYCYGEFGYDTLHTFLDYKFKHNILDSYPDEMIRKCVQSHGYTRIPVSRKVYALVTRFSNVVKHIGATVYLNPVLETLSDYTITWGDDTLETNGKKKVETATVETYKTYKKTHETGFQVGQQVKIIQGHCDFGWNYDMRNAIGETDIIENIDSNDGAIYLKNHAWTWSKGCLKPATDTTRTEQRERRRQFSSHCANCGDGLHEDAEFFTDVTSEIYCEWCYNELFSTCDKCGTEHAKDDLTETPNHPKYYSLCTRCLESVMFQCPMCDEWHVLEDGTYMQDTYEHHCKNCTTDTYCRTCNENYADLRWHNKHEHTRTRGHDRGGVSRPFEIATLHINGSGGSKDVRTAVIMTDNPLLMVYNTHDVQAKIGGTKPSYKWAIHHTLTGRLLNPHCDTWQEALEKANQLAKFDWNFVGTTLSGENKRAITKILGY